MSQTEPTPDPATLAEPVPPEANREGIQTAPEPATPPDRYAVSDAYVARRVEEHAAAVAAEEQRGRESAAGAEPQSALAFYVLLGFVLSVLLLIVILRTSGPTGEPPPGPQRALTSPG
jgi:hypothetical protein